MTFSQLVSNMDGACSALLGAPLKYKPASGPEVEVPGIFDENYIDVKASTEHGFNTVGPAAFFRLADLPTDPRLDDPTITAPNGKKYTVKAVMPDSMGAVVITLTKVNT